MALSTCISCDSDKAETFWNQVGVVNHSPSLETWVMIHHCHIHVHVHAHAQLQNHCAKSYSIVLVQQLLFYW